MKHTAHAQECPLDSFHFAIVEGSQRPFSKAGTIQGSGLIDDDLAILQQAVAGGDGDAPLFKSGINLRCQGQDDDYRCSDRGQRIVLKNQNRTDFADFLPARWIQIGDPDFATADYFHHVAEDSVRGNSPDNRFSAFSSISFSMGRNSSEMVCASCRMLSFEYAARASSRS